MQLESYKRLNKKNCFSHGNKHLQRWKVMIYRASEILWTQCCVKSIETSISYQFFKFSIYHCLKGIKKACFWSQDPYNRYVVVLVGSFQKFCLKIAKIENCQNWKLLGLKVVKIASCQNCKLPKLKIAKITSCQNCIFLMN